MSSKKAICITCIAALMWSIAGLNIKMIDWTPYAIAAGRSIAAVICMIPIIVKSRNLNIDRFTIGGALCYVAFNYCFIVSTKYTTSANAIMLQYTAPVYVALLSWVFLKERIIKADIISMIFVLGGMLLFFMDEAGGGSTLGNIIAVFNGISFAGIAIFLRLQKNGNPVMSMFLGNVFTGIIGIPFMIQAGIPDGKSFGFLLLAGVISAVSYSMYAKASTKLTALETVLIPIVDPIMNPVWVFLFLGEKPGILSIAGAAVVLVAVTGRVIYGLRQDSKQSDEPGNKYVPEPARN